MFDFWNFSVAQPLTGLAATWTSDSTAGGWTVVLDPQGGLQPYFIEWDAATGGQTGSTAMGLASGTYSVTISDVNDCVLVLQIPVGTVSGTTRPDAFAGLLLAPNPTAGRTRLTVEPGMPSAVDVRVFSGTGRQVAGVRLVEKSDRHEVVLDLSGRPAAFIGCWFGWITDSTGCFRC
ncbi:MAG: hypothetical protein IPM98_17865 [Lewinellaceae bacterium]|nr:hypothetical protein [Lewinellaceae bacterium]